MFIYVAMAYVSLAIKHPTFVLRVTIFGDQRIKGFREKGE